jgi:hypothetical protein
MLMPLVSLLVSGAALLVSFRSFNVANTSLVIGQRTYLSISNGRLTVEKDPQDKAHHTSIVSCQFVLQNLGNTPADISPPHITVYAPNIWENEETTFLRDLSSFDPRFPFDEKAEIARQAKGKTVETETGNVPKQRKDEPQFPEQIGPKSDIPFALNSSWTLAPKYEKDFKAEKTQLLINIARGDEPFAVEGHMTYRDVFSVEHDLTWCWVENFSSPYPRQCTGEDEAAIRKRGAESPLSMRSQ